MKRNGMCLILCTILVCLISILFAGCAEKQETNVENMVEELPKEGLQWQTLNCAELSNITDGAFVYIVDYTIADICWWRDDYFSSHAAGFSRKNPSCNIKYESEDAAEDMTRWQAYHDRIMAEIVAGKGPEILLVDRKDLQILFDKGVLADLSGVLSKETEEQIFKGVLAAGTIDGKLVGLADSVRSQTVLVSKNV